MFAKSFCAEMLEGTLYAVSAEGDIAHNPFELLAPAESNLGLGKATLSFDALLASRNNFVESPHFLSRNVFLTSLEKLAKHGGNFEVEFPYSQGKKHFFLSCEILSSPEKKLFLVLLRRLRYLETYFFDIAGRAAHDFTTGLLNKEHCLLDIRSLTSLSKAVVLFCDLNNFKLINDVYGHIAGDRILEEVGKVLTEEKGPHDEVYRFGGDEFVVVMHNAGEKEATLFLERSLHAFQESSANGIPMSFSAGCAVNAPLIKEPLLLIRCADKAMYIAKKKNVPYYFLSPKEIEDLLRLEERK